MIAAAAFVLASAAFKPDAPMLRVSAYDKQGCGGSNISPELHWRGAPRGTRSFALIVRDPDAPVPGGFIHWVTYNIPSGAHGLPANAQLAPDQLGTTTRNEARYGGPCPPPGPAHHYIFTLYALDVAHIAGAHLTAQQLQQAAAHHTLARTSITAIYAR